MDLLLAAVVTSIAIGLILVGDAPRVGIGGALLGFLGAWLLELSRRRRDEKRRFEQERRSAYVHLLQVVREIDRAYGDIYLATIDTGGFGGVGPSLAPAHSIVDEIELLASPSMWAVAKQLVDALYSLRDASEGVGDWQTAGLGFSEARDNFRRRAKADLGTPGRTGIAWRFWLRHPRLAWQLNRRHWRRPGRP